MGPCHRGSRRAFGKFSNSTYFWDYAAFSSLCVCKFRRTLRPEFSARRKHDCISQYRPCHIQLGADSSTGRIQSPFFFTALSVAVDWRIYGALLFNSFSSFYFCFCGRYNSRGAFFLSPFFRHVSGFLVWLGSRSSFFTNFFLFTIIQTVTL